MKAMHQAAIAGGLHTRPLLSHTRSCYRSQPIRSRARSSVISAALFGLQIGGKKANVQDLKEEVNLVYSPRSATSCMPDSHLNCSCACSAAVHGHCAIAERHHSF